MYMYFVCMYICIYIYVSMYMRVCLCVFVCCVLLHQVKRMIGGIGNVLFSTCSQT